MDTNQRKPTPAEHGLTRVGSRRIWPSDFHPNYPPESASIRGWLVGSRFIRSIRGLHHWPESSDDLGEASGYLAQRTVFDAIDQLRESVTSVFDDHG